MGCTQLTTTGARSSSPVSSATPTARPPSTRMCATARVGPDLRAEEAAALRIESATEPMPPCGNPQLTVWLSPPTSPIAWCSST